MAGTRGRSVSERVHEPLQESKPRGHGRRAERGFGWAARFRRLARDDERLPETLAGRDFPAFAILTAHRMMAVITQRR